MRAVRWGIVLTLVALTVVMREPVWWFAIAHAKVVSLSEGFHRALLLDIFFKHFWDWWLIGTNQTGKWGKDMWDIANQFVAEGEEGGLVTFTCFIVMISRSFSWLGKMRRQVEGDRKQEWLYWSLGAIMVAHVFAFLGVRYWDQMAIWWWAFLAMISAATVRLQTAPSRAETLVQHRLLNAASTST